MTKTKKIFKAVGKKRREYLAVRPHRSFRKTKRPRTMPALVTIKQNTIDSVKTIWSERRLLCVLALIYMAATYLFVGGVAQADFVELKNATLDVFGGSFNSLGTVFSLLTSTMSGAFNSNLNELQQFIGVLLALLFWLTLVWALRMRFADKPIKARDALYNSGAPLVSYVVLVFLIIMQLAPGAVGVAIFAVGQGGGYFQGGVEIMSFAAAAALLMALSVYWLAGSLTALVVVTLPQMYPWQAFRIANELAIYRRLRILGHIGALAVMLLVLWIVGLLPALLIDAWLHFDWLPIVPVMVQVLGALTMIYVATYVYRLYRSML